MTTANPMVPTPCRPGEPPSGSSAATAEAVQAAPASPVISVVIPTRSRGQLLFTVLGGLDAQHGIERRAMEVVVVVDGAEKETAEQVRKGQWRYRLRVVEILFSTTDALEADIDRLSFVFDSRAVTAGASAGVAILGADAEAASSLEAADSAMYVRKAQRRHETKSAVA